MLHPYHNEKKKEKTAYNMTVTTNYFIKHKDLTVLDARSLTCGLNESLHHGGSTNS